MYKSPSMLKLDLIASILSVNISIETNLPFAQLAKEYLNPLVIISQPYFGEFSIKKGFLRKAY